MKLFDKFVWCVLFLLVIPASAYAGLGVYADQDGTQQVLSLPVGEEKSFWIIADDTYGGSMSSYEFSVGFPSELVYLGATSFPDDCGAEAPCAGNGPHNFLGSWSPCATGIHKLKLIEYRVRADSALPPGGVYVCLGPSTPSTLDPPQPSFTTCDRFRWPFPLELSSTGNWDGCLLVQSTSVGTEMISWSAAKSMYR